MNRKSKADKTTLAAALSWWECGGPYTSPSQAEATIEEYECAFLLQDTARIARIERFLVSEYLGSKK